MARQAQWAFFGAQVAANPPAFAANISWGCDGGDDVAQAKIVLSANVPVQRLPRRLGIRLLGGAGDIHADRAWCAFLMYGDVYTRLASIGDAPLVQQQSMDDSPPIVSPWSEIQKRRPPILKLAKKL